MPHRNCSCKFGMAESLNLIKNIPYFKCITKELPMFGPTQLHDFHFYDENSHAKTEIKRNRKLELLHHSASLWVSLVWFREVCYFHELIKEIPTNVSHHKRKTKIVLCKTIKRNAYLHDNLLLQQLTPITHPHPSTYLIEKKINTRHNVFRSIFLLKIMNSTRLPST